MKLIKINLKKFWIFWFSILFILVVFLSFIFFHDVSFSTWNVTPSYKSNELDAWGYKIDIKAARSRIKLWPKLISSTKRDKKLGWEVELEKLEQELAEAKQKLVTSEKKLSEVDPEVLYVLKINEMNVLQLMNELFNIKQNLINERLNGIEDEDLGHLILKESRLRTRINEFRTVTSVENKDLKEKIVQLTNEVKKRTDDYIAENDEKNKIVADYDEFTIKSKLEQEKLQTKLKTEKELSSKKNKIIISHQKTIDTASVSINALQSKNEKNLAKNAEKLTAIENKLAAEKLILKEHKKSDSKKISPTSAPILGISIGSAIGGVLIGIIGTSIGLNLSRKDKINKKDKKIK